MAATMSIMRRAPTGLWSLLLLVGVAAAAAGQNAPASADAQKLETAWASLRARNARDYAVGTPNGIDEGRYVEVGGIQQWITIRGEDRNNPGRAGRPPRWPLPGPFFEPCTVALYRTARGSP